MKTEDVMKALFDADPVAFALWQSDPFFHRALDYVRAHERSGHDPLAAAVSALVFVCQDRKRLMDAEIERAMREQPEPPTPGDGAGR